MEKKNNTYRIIITVALTMIVVAGTALFLLNSFKEMHIKKSLNHLSTINNLKKQALLDLYREALVDISILGNDDRIMAAFTEFHHLFSENNTINPDLFHSPGKKGVDLPQGYFAVYEKHNHFIDQFITQKAYYDIFLLENRYGGVLYTWAKERDLGAEISAYPDIALNALYRQVLDTDSIILSDFERYHFSNDMSSQFIAGPIVIDGRTAGVIVLQINSENINKIIQDRTGLGQTGETYLVGEDLLMRSDSYFTQDSTLLQLKVDTLAVREGLGNKRGELLITDYRGVQAATSFSPLEINTICQTTFNDWVIISEMDRAEIQKPVTSIHLNLIYILIIGLVLITLIHLIVPLIFKTDSQIIIMDEHKEIVEKYKQIEKIIRNNHHR